MIVHPKSSTVLGKLVAVLLVSAGLLLFAFLRPLFAQPPGTTYHVSINGSDSNPGTQASPWKTIQKAARTMVPGDTVLIHAGTYLEKVIPARSGTSWNYITYKDYGDGEVIIDAQNGARSNAIEVINKSYLQFIGLHLRGAWGPDTLNAAFAAYNGANHLIIDNIIAETSRFGILLDGKLEPVSFITIKNSEVMGNASHGVFFYYKVYDSTIGPDNHIHDNGTAGDDGYGINIDTNYPGDPLDGARRVTVIGNEVDHNYIQGIRPWNAQYLLIKDNYTHDNGATGIQVENGCAFIVVDGNRSENNAQSYEYEAGIWIDSAVNAVVENNVLRGNQIGLMITDAKGVIARNNTIYKNNRGLSSNIMGAVINRNSSAVRFVQNTLWKNGVGGSRGNLMLCSKPPVSDVVIKNNILSESAGSNDSWTGCVYTSDYNNYYNTRSLSFYWPSSDLGWSEYLNVSRQDLHSSNTDPLFVFAAGGDFRLSPGSPNIDTGADLTHTTAAGSGTTIAVADAEYFTDGMGVVAGDTIRVGQNTVLVTKVDYAANTLTVDKNITWNSGDSVTYPYSGAKPEKGSMEFTGSATPSYIPTPPGSGSASGNDALTSIIWTDLLGFLWSDLARLSRSPGDFEQVLDQKPVRLPSSILLW